MQEKIAIARRPRLFTRRRALYGLGTVLAGAASVGGYAFGIAPFGQRITRYALTPPGWTPGFKLKIAVVTDLHICEPYLGLARLEAIVAETNALGADVIALLGDYVPGTGMLRFASLVPMHEWARLLIGLKAPFGVHAILGNHDWWEDRQVQRSMQGPSEAQRALLAAGMPVLENKALRFVKDGQPFWIAGLGDQWAFYGRREHPRNRERSRFLGVDDLDGTLAQVKDSAPVVLLAHEPDIFPRVPQRVSLTLAGHTHGGQVTLAGYAPVVPSRFGRRFVYGHIVEDGRNLIVSSGLGCSGLPVRLGASPEIVLVELGG